MRASILLLLLLIPAGALALSAYGAPPAAPATLALETPAGAQPAGAPIDVPVRLSGVSNLGAWEFDLLFDPDVVTVTGLTVQPFFGASENCPTASARCAVALGPVELGQAGRGRVAVGAFSYGQAAGPSGAGVVAIIRLQPTGRGGTTALRVANALLSDTAANPAAVLASEATLTVAAAPDAPGVGPLYLPMLSR